MLKHSYLFLFFLLAVLLGCNQEEKQVTIADLEARYNELNGLNTDLDQQKTDLYKLIREFNSTRQETDQFDIASIDTVMGISERELLRAMFKEEKDISYNGLLKTIILKNDEIIQLNDKIIGLNENIAQLEAKLPKAYVVKKGDSQYQIVRDFLMNEHGMDKKQAREVAWKTAMTDNLLPGNRIWLSYDKENSVVGTFVTQGEAKIPPMAYEQIAKKKMIQKVIEQSVTEQKATSVSAVTTQISSDQSN